MGWREDWIRLRFQDTFLSCKSKWDLVWLTRRIWFTSANNNVLFFKDLIIFSCCSLGALLALQFYLEKRSILGLGDITVVIPDDEADIAVLEEPEHLTWYHHGKRWKSKFRLVIGIVHTNYREIVKRERNALEAFFLKYINSWVVNIYCHRVIHIFRISFLLWISYILTHKDFVLAICC